MRKPKYTDKHIETILSKYEDKSMTVTEICREYDISDTTFYKWRASSDIARKSQRLLKKKDAEIALVCGNIIISDLTNLLTTFLLLCIHKIILDKLTYNL